MKSALLIIQVLSQINDFHSIQRLYQECLSNASFGVLAKYLNIKKDRVRRQKKEEEYEDDLF